MRYLILKLCSILDKSALSQHLPQTEKKSWQSSVEVSGRDINLASPEYDAGATHSTALISN
jgi:hypothetical protein